MVAKTLPVTKSLCAIAKMANDHRNVLVPQLMPKLVIYSEIKQQRRLGDNVPQCPDDGFFSASSLLQFFVADIAVLGRKSVTVASNKR